MAGSCGLYRPRINAVPELYSIETSCSSDNSSVMMPWSDFRHSTRSGMSNLNGGTSSGCSDYAEMDTHLAEAGYRVKSSNLPHLAQRLELLDAALSSTQEADNSEVYELVHSNPSDLAGWIESLIGTISPSQPLKTGDEQLCMPLVGSSSLNSTSQVDTRGFYVGDAGHSNVAETSVGSQSGSELIQDSIVQSGRPQSCINAQSVSSYTSVGLLGELDGYDPYRLVLEDQTSSTNSGQINAKNQPIHVPLPQTKIVPPSTMVRRPGSRHQKHSPYPHHVQGHATPVKACSGSSHKVISSPLSQEQARQPKRVRHDTQDRVLGIKPSPLSITSPMVGFQQHSERNPKALTQSVLFLDSKSVAMEPNVHGSVLCMEESGIRLVHLLVACAEAVNNGEYAAAVEMVAEIKKLATPQSGTIGKVANHFVEGLKARICGRNIKECIAESQASEATLSEYFYETCPYLKFAHFTANHAILEAFQGHKFVHVIDFNLMQGFQWPALIQALALRRGGPPHVRLTGIGPNTKTVLHDVGSRLAQFAKQFNVAFDFKVASKLDDVKREVRREEAVAVNSMFQLHCLLYQEHPDSQAPIHELLQSVRSFNPKVVTVAEQEANHNCQNFMERFVQALHYYSTMFDSLEACSAPPNCQPVLYTEMYLGREIINIVACEGALRTERHEQLSNWRSRIVNSGFVPWHLGSNAYMQASMLVKMFSGDGYTVEENAGCLTLGWHSRPLIASSAWQCG